MAALDGPWFPIIFCDRCDGCVKTGNPRCVEFCSHGVFATQDGKAVVARPDKCLSGCNACKSVCHAKAIQFPERSSPYTSNFLRTNADLLRKTVCPKCKKIYWTNRETDSCFDCENPK